jgi:beta-lactam-binding protein with PASTA domain
MKSLFRFAMMALVLVVVALVSALTAMRFAIHGQEVEVPAIVGKTPAEAERVVAGLGLQIEVERQYYSAQIPEGRIMTQLPLPGTKVRRGWQVRVARSLGPQRVVIPDVTKQSERAAEWNIQRRGLEVASTAEMQLPGTPSDLVLAQSPPANASQVEAPRTSLLVTVAADPSAYVMPSFLGQPLGTASRTLQDAGFKLGNVTLGTPANPATSSAAPAVPAAPSSEPSPASIIVTQTPPAGQKVLAGAVVNFEVR